MNRSTLIGVVAGVGIAMAGGVAAYTFLGNNAELSAELGAEECWNEEIVVQAEPFDQHRIAGTVGGAIVGGAVGKDVGDRDITTAVGAAAGALIGREIEEEIQENREDKRTTTTIERRWRRPVPDEYDQDGGDWADRGWRLRVGVRQLHLHQRHS